MECIEDSEEYIKEIFEKLNIGKIKKIKLINLGRWIKGNMVYIKMEYWNISEMVANFQKKILDPNLEATIIHNAPDYWVIIPALDLNNYTINESKNNSELQNAFNNNSCCGAVSDAWIPSNPS